LQQTLAFLDTASTMPVRPFESGGESDVDMMADHNWDLTYPSISEPLADLNSPFPGFQDRELWATGVVAPVHQQQSRHFSSESGVYLEEAGNISHDPGFSAPVQVAAYTGNQPFTLQQTQPNPTSTVPSVWGIHSPARLMSLVLA
jgi:hypothetical protein